jgi:hypothetical protein
MRIKNFDKVSKEKIVDKIIACFTMALLCFGLFNFKHFLIGYLITSCAFFSFHVTCELDFKEKTIEFKTKKGGFCSAKIIMYFVMLAIMKFFVFLIVLIFVEYPY